MYNPTSKVSLTSKLPLFCVCDAPIVLTQHASCHASNMIVGPSYLANDLLPTLYCQLSTAPSFFLALATGCACKFANLHDFALPHTPCVKANSKSQLHGKEAAGTRQKKDTHLSFFLLLCPFFLSPSLSPLAAVTNRIKCLSSRDGKVFMATP